MYNIPLNIRLYIVPEETCQGMQIVKNSIETMNIHKVFNFAITHLNFQMCIILYNTIECFFLKANISVENFFF